MHMKLAVSFISLIIIAFIWVSCEENNESNFSGIYCLNVQNMEMTILQSGDLVTFSISYDQLNEGTGIINGDTLLLTASILGEGSFTATLRFSGDRKSFTGPYQIADNQGNPSAEGILQGYKGTCVTFDIDKNGIPKFIEADFTQHEKIEMISKFRSGFGHSFTDGTEACRSMKHYYTPFVEYRENNNVEIYSPVKGTIVSLMHDAEGGPSGLYNTEVQIMPDNQPAFVIQIFHCDLVSPDMVIGKRVAAGEKIGFARMYYTGWDQYVTSFDIALWVNTPSGMRLISYFEALTEAVFNHYASGETYSRQDFIITKEDRDADPLECDGESFVNGGNLENWVVLQ